MRKSICVALFALGVAVLSPTRGLADCSPFRGQYDPVPGSMVLVCENGGSCGDVPAWEWFDVYCRESSGAGYVIDFNPVQGDVVFFSAVSAPALDVPFVFQGSDPRWGISWDLQITSLDQDEIVFSGTVFNDPFLGNGSPNYRVYTDMVATVPEPNASQLMGVAALVLILLRFRRSGTDQIGHHSDCWYSAPMDHR